MCSLNCGFCIFCAGMADLIDDLTVPWVECVSIFAAFGLVPFATIFISANITVNVRYPVVSVPVEQVFLFW